MAEKSGVVKMASTMLAKSSVNVRKDATTSSEKIGVYARSNKVEVIGKVNNGWYKVNLNGQEGYVSISLIISTKSLDQAVVKDKVKTFHL